jgi:hypothetical protein
MACADVKGRCAVWATRFEKIATDPDPVFQDPLKTWLFLQMAQMDLHTMLATMANTYKHLVVPTLVLVLLH